MYEYHEGEDLHLDYNIFKKKWRKYILYFHSSNKHIFLMTSLILFYRLFLLRQPVCLT